MAGKQLIIDALCQRWVHSREEDTEYETVYRPSGFPFPPTRGREAFELLPDKSYRGAAIGSTDISVVTEGTWALHGEDRSQIRIECGGNLDLLDVVSVDSDRLVIGKKHLS